jgi:hypothetical protein
MSQIILTKLSRANNNSFARIIHAKSLILPPANV